jgi:hypothetical protein
MTARPSGGSAPGHQPGDRDGPAGEGAAWKEELLEWIYVVVGALTILAVALRVL